MKRALPFAAMAAAAALLGLLAWQTFAGSHVDRRVRGFSPDQLTPRGQRAYATLLAAECVESTFRSWTWDEPEATYSLLDLWDEDPELSTQALLSICERGTPAARFYALAGLAESDPWTFDRAWPRYRGDDSHTEIQLGCFVETGPLNERFEKLVLAGGLAYGWRGVWSRTERNGAGLDRDLTAEYLAQRAREQGSQED